MWNVDHNSRHWKKDTGIWDEMFPQTPRYLPQRSHNQRGRESQNWKRLRAVWRLPDFKVKRHKLKWYGKVTRSSGLAKTIIQGTVEGWRRRGRQRKRWEDNIKEWTDLKWNIILRKAENREEMRKLVVKSTVVSQQSARLRDQKIHFDSETSWVWCFVWYFWAHRQ